MDNCFMPNVSDTSLIVTYGGIDLTGGILATESDAVMVETESSEAKIATSINGTSSAADAPRITNGKVTLKMVTGSDELETLKEYSMLQQDDGIKAKTLIIDSLNSGLHMELTCAMLNAPAVLFRSGSGSQLYEEVVFTFSRVQNYKRPNK